MKEENDMTEENDREALERRAKHLRETVDRLRHALQGKAAENTNLRTRVKHLEDAVAQEHKWFVQTHSAMNLLRQDAERVMTEHGVDDLHQELTEARRRYDDLWNKRVQWRSATRNAVEKLAEARQQVRDLEEVLEQQRQRITTVEEERDALTGRAELVVDERDAQLERIKYHCELWMQGKLPALDALAGILAEHRGSKLPEPGDWERTKALKVAEMRAELTQLTRDLASVNTALNEAGIEIVSTHAVAVRDLAAQLRGAYDLVDEWKTLEAQARSGATSVAKHYGADAKVLHAISVGDYAGLLVMLTGEYASTPSEASTT